MGNTIAPAPSALEQDCIHMSNGLTDVFFNVLVLSGSALARSDSEKRLVVWLAEHDQSRVGLGTVSFDLPEMPWETDTFERDKAFLRRTVAAARNRLGWEKLDYHPNEELLFPCLDRFVELVSGMDAGKIQPEHLRAWLAESSAADPVKRGFPLCPKHQTLLSVFGCHICNN